MRDSSERYGSWSRLPFGEPSSVVLPDAASVDLGTGVSLLPFGQGRSYGDTCVNPGGGILDTARMNRVLEFDTDTGTLRCEAGTTLVAILDRIVPAGWFLPVCPGAMQVTVGGAIAHDVHGKNQVSAGTFGCHVASFELARSSGEKVHCSATSNPDLFEATIGGLGLTGLILEVELRLKRVHSAYLRTETVRCSSVEELLGLMREPSEYDHVVAWLDSFRHTRSNTHCVLFRGKHSAEEPPRLPRRRARRRPRLLPGVPPWLFRRSTVRLFNRAYYHLVHARKRSNHLQHYETFLFPGESAQPTNRHYGRNGVFAYHCLVPPATAEAALHDLLERTSRGGDTSLSTVIKPFGERRSPGTLSFSGPGLSIVLGFPNEGERTLALMAELDRFVAEAGGKLYPAKDARIPAAMFRSSFPRWREFSNHVDPGFSSSFWRRVADGSSIPSVS